VPEYSILAGLTMPVATGHASQQQTEQPPEYEFRSCAKMAAFSSQSPNFQGRLMIEERLVNIETKLTFQEDLVEELSKTVYQQQKKLEYLEALCESLARHVDSLAAASEGKPANERPPHY
jgi:SlyX protein